MTGYLCNTDSPICRTLSPDLYDKLIPAIGPRFGGRTSRPQISVRPGDASKTGYVLQMELLPSQRAEVFEVLTARGVDVSRVKWTRECFQTD